MDTVAHDLQILAKYARKPPLERQVVLLVSAPALARKPALAAWVRRGVSFARSLPPDCTLY